MKEVMLFASGPAAEEAALAAAAAAMDSRCATTSVGESAFSFFASAAFGFSNACVATLSILRCFPKHEHLILQMIHADARAKTITHLHCRHRAL